VGSPLATSRVSTPSVSVFLCARCAEELEQADWRAAGDRFDSARPQRLRLHIVWRWGQRIDRVRRPDRDAGDDLTGLTEKGDVNWEQATPSSYVYDAGDWSAAVMSDGPPGPFRFQLTDARGAVEGELNEHSESPPEMGNWRAELNYLYTLAGRVNPRQAQLLDKVARDLGGDSL
jgi:hypothetical protein